MNRLLGYNRKHLIERARVMYMNSREELTELLILARALSGEKDVLKHIESEEQFRAIGNVMMAKDMKPSKEEWEKLGFSFIDVPGDKILCNAMLPEGWSMKATSHSMSIDIIDENGMRRGSMFYKGTLYDRNANMSLLCRYAVCSNRIEDDGITTEIYFGNETEKLFVAGQTHVSMNMSYEERCAQYDKNNELVSLAEQYGDRNYPNWRDIHAYWTDDMTLSQRPIKK